MERPGRPREPPCRGADADLLQEPGADRAETSGSPALSHVAGGQREWERSVSTRSRTGSLDVFYLITGENGSNEEGTLGYATGAERSNFAPCPDVLSANRKLISWAASEAARFPVFRTGSLRQRAGAPRLPPAMTASGAAPP